MEKEIYYPLGNFITNKSLLLAINKQHRADLDEILKDSHEIVQKVKVVSSFERSALIESSASQHLDWICVLIFSTLRLASLTASSSSSIEPGSVGFSSRENLLTSDDEDSPLVFVFRLKKIIRGSTIWLVFRRSSIALTIVTSLNWPAWTVCCPNTNITFCLNFSK